MKKILYTLSICIFLFTFLITPSTSLAQSAVIMRDLGQPPRGCGFVQQARINNFGQIAGTCSDRAFLWTELGGFRDLGTLGGLTSEAADVNNLGEIVGTSTTSGAQGNRAFLWTAANGMIDLGTLGGSESEAFANNDQGQVVGLAYTTSGKYHAFLWDAHDGMTDLGSLGGQGTWATNINEMGQVTGSGYMPNNSIQRHAFRWTKENGMIDLGTLGGTDSQAGQINDLGQIVGVSTTATGQPHAFLWTEQNGMIDLGTLGGTSSTAFSINNLGHVMGYSITPLGQERAFFWKPEYGMIDLGVLDGYRASWPTWINNQDQLVGYSYGIASGGDAPHPFLWTEKDGMVDLVGVGGPHSMALAINDQGQIVGDSATGSAGHNVVLWTMSSNQPPTVSAGGPYVVEEGGSALVTGSGTDPEGGSLTFAWDLNNDRSFETPGQSVTFSATGLDGPSTYTIRVHVTDNAGLSAINQANINVLNIAPTVGGITGLVAPISVNTAINMGASFTDPGVSDTHIAVWEWGDSSTTPGVIAETDGSGSVTANQIYTVPGVYTVKLTVTDDDGDSGQSIFQYAVIYNPSAGYVTGAGVIDSPIGAYIPNASLIGKANFGFVAKYEKGATIPTGQTQFRFHVANMNFNSTSYDWLVVAGSHVKYKGIGTLNGSGNYGFMITAIDGQLNGSESADTFRIKIWDKNNGNTVVYDNQLGQSDDSYAGTAISGGNIVIHPNGHSNNLTAATTDASVNPQPNRVFLPIVEQ